jgi:glycosyltransferase involved in cell wall biosynthesis
MKLLFIHQNFPAQFVHIATLLAKQGHEVVALGVEGRPLPGIKFLRYKPKLDALRKAPNLVQEIAVKAARGLGVAAALAQIKAAGFQPNVIVAHAGWGESLFVKDVWPDVPLLCFLEFFYRSQGADYGFDPEFSTVSDEARHRIRMRNSAHLMAMHAMDWGLTPTRWQHSTLPLEYQKQTSIIFDGIDTTVIAPKAEATFTIPGTQRVLRKGDQVLTFVNRNIEPYRGCHIFIRALPQILKNCPEATVVIVGDTGVSYGAAAPAGTTWKDVFLKEVQSQLPAGWEERVIFTGRIPHTDFVSLFQVSACHVYLTYPFVLSWSCLEAMSVGCTVIASDTQPVREVITDGQDGILTDFFDVQALAEKATEALRNPSQFVHLGANARCRVVDRYDLKTKSLPAQASLLNALATGVLPNAL